MRVFFYCLPGLGFLALIAFSWRTPDTSMRAVASISSPELFANSPSRAPAPNARASYDEIRRLEECAISGKCNFPKGSSYKGSVNEALAVTLAEHFTNFGADAELARNEIQNPDPLVQSVALRMLTALPPSGESLSALEIGLRDTSDPALVEGSIHELERYLGTSYETDAQRIVENLVGQGALVRAQQATTMLLPFINEHSYDEFRALLAHLDSGAEAAGLLRAALHQYESTRHGG